MQELEQFGPQQERRLKVLLWVMGQTQELRRLGLVAIDGLDLTGKGKEAYKQLLQDGFQPTNDEIDTAMAKIQSGVDVTVSELGKEILRRDSTIH